MNTAPTSTPFQVPGFNGADNNATPTEFLKFLRSLTTQYLGENTSRITSDNKDTWVTIVDGLTDHLLGTFPPPDIVSWDTMKEKIVMTEATLEVIGRVFLRVDGIYDASGDLVRKLFARLLDLCRVLDIWIETEVLISKDSISPCQLKERALSVLTSILRGLGDGVSATPEQSKPYWKTLRSVLQECVDTCNDLLVPSTPNVDCVVVSFFRKPRIISLNASDPDPEANHLNVLLSPTIHIPSFLVLLLEVAMKIMTPALRCDWYLIDIGRSISEFSRAFLVQCLNPTFHTTSAIRSKTLIRILSATAPLRVRPAYRPLIGDLLEYFLQLRLEAGLDLEWDAVDDFLAEAFKTEVETPILQELIFSATHRLQMYHWGPENKKLHDLLWSYLRSVLPRIRENLLPIIKEQVAGMQQSPERDALLQQLAQPPSITSPPDVNRGRLLMAPHVWRQRVHALVEEIIYPDTLSWMDDDEGSNVPHLCKRSLYEIRMRFEEREIEQSAEARFSMIKKLANLQCFLAQCDKTDCTSQTAHNEFLTASEYFPLIHRLLRGTAEEVTPECRRRIHDALGFILRHHSGNDDVKYIIEPILCGMSDPDRSVRISAGRALNNLVQTYGTQGSRGFRRAEVIFSRLYQLFETSKNPVRETLLVAVGSMGKTGNSEVLGQVLCLLIAQLGRQNPVIKGSACMHILAVARHSKKTPYSLILPYMNQVAPYILKQLPLQPDLLKEACRLMSIAPADFIVITLPRTLPELFAACDAKALETISRELDTKASSLLLKHSHSILAHIFLLHDNLATNKGLNFVIKVLTDATSSAIDIQSVVKSCIVPLLAELVVVMGDEDESVAKQGVVALKRVEVILAAGKKGGATSTGQLGAFLKTYMLGLISDINDMLQDVQGKKPVEIKRKILRSLGALVGQIGPIINNVSPQIMATFQTMVGIPELSEVTLESWLKFFTTLGAAELGPHIGPTSAAIVNSWHTLSSRGRLIAFEVLEHVICNMGDTLQQYLAEIVDLSVIEDLLPLHDQLQVLRGTSSPAHELDRILNQSSSDNITVATQALQELKTFMLKTHSEYIRAITSGDIFDPNVGRILASLLATACRDHGDGSEALRLLSFECIGVLGAVDPDRCEIPSRNTSMVVMKNFNDEGEAVLFALHLIQDLLVGAFRSTSDIKYQSHLAYSIQELLKFCQFTPALVAAGNSVSVPIKVRNRWNALPKHVLETVTPLLEARFTLNQNTASEIQHPIYPTQSTYREWLQIWTTYLITKASGPTAQKLFGVFRSAVRNKDVVVAHHLLPHLVLNILISGNEDDAQLIRKEMLTVLEDQVDVDSHSTSDKKLLSAQAIFMLLDHLNKWVRLARQELNRKGQDLKRPRDRNVRLDEQLLRLDSILANIDQSLMAKAAFQCKAFARSVMNFERQIITIREREGDSQRGLPEYYERLHEIYAHLDEPDGMEGISTLIVSPTLEHQIRQHETTGKWTSAQSCWEVRLQESPDNVEHHLGLLRCLRNLGHYDTLRTHVMGVLTRHPEWEGALAGFHVESAWMVGAWEDVQKIVDRVDNSIPSVATGKALLAMRSGDAEKISKALSQARSLLGAPITAAGVKGYRRSYDAVLDLHLTHELEVIYQTCYKLIPGSQDDNRHRRRQTLAELSRTLSARLSVTLPTFRNREPLLSMRRTAFGLLKNQRLGLNREIGKSWLASAKIGRRANQWQTSYSAMLQAQQRKTPYCFIESAKLLQASGNTLRALTELENSIKFHRLFDNQVVDLTSDTESELMKAKIRVLQARWMNESDRFEASEIFDTFTEAANLATNWESGHFYLGQFQDDVFKTYSPSDQKGRGLKTNLHTVRSFSRAIMHGSKFVYQTVPRMLTIWLDLGEDRVAVTSDAYKKIMDSMTKATKDAPVYKWFTAFPQIVSRVAHDNPEVYKVLRMLIMRIIQEYPKQALWLFASVVKSTKENRSKRGNEILAQLRNNPRNRESGLPQLITESLEMTNQLLALCDHYVEDNRVNFNMSKDFPRLKRIGNSNMIIPLQESLTASLPPKSAEESTFQPFPLNTPTFREFYDEVEIMKSLARPRKITIKGSNGQVYMFLGKPKDDLRKDARLMDLNAIINKLLKGNSESRRRQLHIRTYGVVTLNEECGFIQWVPNTVPMRPVLLKLYNARGMQGWEKIGQVFVEMKPMTPEDAAAYFQKRVLSVYKAVFHDWFVETFPEPSAWLASRMSYSRTLAVMSMVGFILGLGDRHCENILLDTNTGDVVHVDFNCLFEKGKTLETPERVPFRLTQNLVDGLGVSGVEGIFRISCEVTMQLLRDNKDMLMSVLDAFVHDPLVEWEDEKRKMERGTRKSNNAAANKVKIQDLAKGALLPIEKKLKGVYTPYSSKERHEKELSTSNLVQSLITEATDLANLAKMYVGWGPWH